MSQHSIHRTNYLPLHLSAEQAALLCDVLAELQEALWEHYEAALLRWWARRVEAPPPPVHEQSRIHDACHALGRPDNYPKLPW
jgi:hypothetical protein